MSHDDEERIVERDRPTVKGRRFGLLSKATLLLGVDAIQPDKAGPETTASEGGSRWSNNGPAISFEVPFRVLALIDASPGVRKIAQHFQPASSCSLSLSLVPSYPPSPSAPSSFTRNEGRLLRRLQIHSFPNPLPSPPSALFHLLLPVIFIEVSALDETSSEIFSLKFVISRS